MKKKVNHSVRLHQAIQEKLKTESYSEQIQVLTQVPGKWSQMYCSEYVNVFNNLFQLHMKSKKQVKYEQNLLLEKEKTITPETLHLETNVYEDDNFSRQVPEKKDYVSVNKGVYEEKLCNL